MERVIWHRHGIEDVLRRNVGIVLAWSAAPAQRRWCRHSLTSCRDMMRRRIRWLRMIAVGYAGMRRLVARTRLRLCRRANELALRVTLSYALL